MPDATAARFSKATCIHGMFHAVSGYAHVVTSRQPVQLRIRPGQLVEILLAFVTGRPVQFEQAGKIMLHIVNTIHPLCGFGCFQQHRAVVGTDIRLSGSLRRISPQAFPIGEI